MAKRGTAVLLFDAGSAREDELRQPGIWSQREKAGSSGPWGPETLEGYAFSPLIPLIARIAFRNRESELDKLQICKLRLLLKPAPSDTS